MTVRRLLVIGSFFLLPSAALAQSPALPLSSPAGQQAAAGPRVDVERVGIAPAAVAARSEAASATAAAPRLGESVALMAVGGAALVAGLIIGGDAGTVVALGGAVIGLIGLYQYLK